MSIEELIENRRAELSAKSDLTPVNLETFVKWKKRKLREKAEAVTKSDTKKKDNVKSRTAILPRTCRKNENARHAKKNSNGSLNNNNKT